mgnify:CR=1 FL=1
MSEAPTQLALVFPGQGSQSIGMLAELSELHPSVKAAFEEASDGAGVDLWALSQAGPEEMLNRTEYTQPALLAAGVAVTTFLFGKIHLLTLVFGVMLKMLPVAGWGDGAWPNKVLPLTALLLPQLAVIARRARSPRIEGHSDRDDQLGHRGVGRRSRRLHRDDPRERPRVLRARWRRRGAGRYLSGPHLGRLHASGALRPARRGLGAAAGAHRILAA